MKKLFLIIAIVVFFFGIPADLMAQNPQDATVVEDSQEIRSKGTDESAYVITSEVSSELNEKNDSGLGTAWLFLRMIVVLALVVACIYLVMRFMKKKFVSNVSDNDPYLRRTASLSLEVGKSVHIVTLNDKAYILGVSENSVTLIDKLDDKDLIDAMNINAEVAQSEAGKKDFASMLSSLIPGFGSKDNFQQSEDAASRMKKHHSRLSDLNGEDK